jgi:hypothetical protein
VQSSPWAIGFVGAKLADPDRSRTFVQSVVFESAGSAIVRALV